jgi:hypothetical protein
MNFKTHRGQNTLSSLLIVVFLLFLVIIPINMLIQGTRDAYLVPNAQNFTFYSAIKITNVTNQMTSTLISTEPKDVGPTSLITTVVNGAINALQLFVVSIGSVYEIFTDFFNVYPLSYTTNWLPQAAIGVFGIVVTVAIVAAYLRWRP